MGTFITIELDYARITPEIAARLVSVCPVDIFALKNAYFTIQPEQEDECTLCELCLDVAPANSLSIHKHYGQPSLVSRGKV